MAHSTATTSRTHLTVPQVVVTDMSKGSTTASNPSADLNRPADIITLRLIFEGKQHDVWIDTPETYEALLNRTQAEFANELKGISPTVIVFVVSARLDTTYNNRSINGGISKVRIGRSDEAWSRVVNELVRYEIIEVHVEGSSPPPYADTKTTPSDAERERESFTANHRRSSRSPIRSIASIFCGHPKSQGSSDLHKK